MNMMAELFFLLCKDKMIPELLADGYLTHSLCLLCVPSYWNVYGWQVISFEEQNLLSCPVVIVANFGQSIFFIKFTYQYP